MHEKKKPGRTTDQIESDAKHEHFIKILESIHEQLQQAQIAAHPSARPLTRSQTANSPAESCIVRAASAVPVTTSPATLCEDSDDIPEQPDATVYSGPSEGSAGPQAHKTIKEQKLEDLECFYAMSVFDMVCLLEGLDAPEAAQCAFIARTLAGNVGLHIFETNIERNMWNAFNADFWSSSSSDSQQGLLLTAMRENKRLLLSNKLNHQDVARRRLWPSANKLLNLAQGQITEHENAICKGLKQVADYDGSVMNNFGVSVTSKSAQKCMKRESDALFAVLYEMKLIHTASFRTVHQYTSWLTD